MTTPPIPSLQSKGSKPDGSLYRFGFRSLIRGLRELLSFNFLGTALFIAAIAIGFVQGWLKFTRPSLLVHLSYDLLLIGAIIATVISLPKGTSLFPKSFVASALYFQIAVCFVYLFISFEIPYLISIASFRGWCLAPMGFVLGYHLTRSVRQVEVFILLLIALGTATAIYGAFFQSAAEIEAMIAANPSLQQHLMGIYYATETGSSFRTFSTFVTPAAFGGTLAYCIIFAFSRMTVPNCPFWERIPLLFASAIMMYGVVLSGARTALLIAVSGLLVTAWYRRSFVKFALIPGGLLFISVIVGNIFREGTSGRFQSLLNLNEIWGRFFIVYRPAMTSLSESFMGGGLGRSGHGVPTFLEQLARTVELRAVDGDLGRIIVDFGIIGLFLFFYIVIAGVKDSMEWMKELRDTPPGVIALPCTAMFALTLIMWPTGSPFLAVPSGVLVWFFMGSARRILDEYQQHRKTKSETVDQGDELSVSYLTSAKQPFKFFTKEARVAHDPGRAGQSTLPKGKAPNIRSTPVKDTRRFLYKRD